MKIEKKISQNRKSVLISINFRRDGNESILLKFYQTSKKNKIKM